MPLEAPAPEAVGTPQLRVVGVGGAGVNAVNRMIEAGIPGVEFMAINTDLQSLQQSTADVTVHPGCQLHGRTTVAAGAVLPAAGAPPITGIAGLTPHSAATVPSSTRVTSGEATISPRR